MGMFYKMMKYKIGEKVKVCDDLIVDHKYEGLSFVDTMEKYKGNTVTIKRVNGDTYNIEEDDGKWFWNDAMLEDAEPTKPLMERKVLQLDQIANMEIHVSRVIINDPAVIMFYRTPVVDNASGAFKSWSNEKKIVAKCNKEIGDEFDIEKGVEVAILKAYRKEIDKLLRKY